MGIVRAVLCNQGVSKLVHPQGDRKSWRARRDISIFVGFDNVSGGCAIVWLSRISNGMTRPNSSAQRRLANSSCLFNLWLGQADMCQRFVCWQLSISFGTAHGPCAVKLAGWLAIPLLPKWRHALANGSEHLLLCRKRGRNKQPRSGHSSLSMCW